MENLGYKTILLYCLVAAICRRYTVAQTTADVNQVFTDKLSTASGYNKNVRPGPDQTKPLEVNVTLNVMTIHEFDEVAEKFSMVGFFTISWIEERVSWSPAAYSGVGTILALPSEVWVPKFTLANPFEKMKEVGTDLAKVRYFSSGLALWSPGDIMKSTCSVDVTYYPFDIQVCELLFFPYSYSSFEIKTKTPESTILQGYYNENGEWRLSDTSAAAFEQDFLPFVKFSLTLERRSTYAIVNVILPIIFMSFLNLLVFILPAESGERVGYAITVLLSIAVFLTLVNDNMPKSSKPMSLMNYYLLTIFIMSALICFFTNVILRLYHKPEEEDVPSWLKGLVRKLKCNSRKIQVYVVPVKEAKKNLQKENRNVRSKNIDRVEIGGPDITMPVTWVNVGQTADILCLVFCLIYVIVSTTGFVVVIATRTQI